MNLKYDYTCHFFIAQNHKCLFIKYMMMPLWVTRVNTESNIHSFVNEAFLWNQISKDDISELNWMRIFNSKIPLSNEFIIHYSEFIDWKWLTRILDESIIHRFRYKIVQWDAQLYGGIRTIEFMHAFENKFNWKLISHNPPDWFSDIHFEIFGNLMNWKSLSRFSHKMSPHIFIMYGIDMDWEWISENNIRDEIFARQFIHFISWDHPNLDVSNLSTEFLFNIKNMKKNAYHMRKKILSKSENKPQSILGSTLALGFDTISPLQIGATISLDFALKHQDELDWLELTTKKLITDEMRYLEQWVA